MNLAVEFTKHGTFYYPPYERYSLKLPYTLLIEINKFEPEDKQRHDEQRERQLMLFKNKNGNLF